MDIRDILKSFDNLSEATTATDKGTIHKAGPGGYGNRHGSDDVTDQYGKPKGKVSLSSLGPKDDKPKQKGRPVDPDRPKLGKDDPKNKKVGDLFGRTTGAVPKGKKGTTISGKSQSHPDNKKDDGTGDEETTSKKSLKEYFDQMDEEKLGELSTGLVNKVYNARQQNRDTASAADSADFDTRIQAKADSMGKSKWDSSVRVGPGQHAPAAAAAQQKFDRNKQLTINRPKTDYGRDQADATAWGQKVGQTQGSGMMREAGLAVQPMPATPAVKAQQQMATKPSFMIKDPANPSMPAITTQDPAVVQAAKNGTMSMQKPGAATTAPGATPAAGAGSQVKPMEEDGENWIKGAIKHPGAFTKKASSHGMTPKEFANKVLAHKKDYPAKTEKQAQLAKTLGKMHESQGESPYTLELISSEERDDPEGWSTMNVGTFKVLKNGKEIGTAEWDDYFGNLEIDINGKRQQLKYDSNHPLLKMAKHAVEEPINIAQRAHHGVKEAEAPQHFAQSSPLSTANRGVLEGKKGVNPFAKKDNKKKPDENNNNIPDYAEDGKGKNDLKKKGVAPKKGVNPFAKKDEKKKVKEGMEHHLQAARLEGKSHALRKMPYNCTHDDMEEARCYHDGFKEGLDECYGQMPILGRTAVDEVSPEVGTMASYGAHDEMDEGNAFTAGLAKTPHGGKFKVGGSTFTDGTSYDSNLDEFAFEAFDSQLKALLESEEKVSEGMTVSISKGQQGSPDSVSVSAQDGEADQLLSIIKSAGMGLFGGDEQNGYGAPQGSAGAHGGISVVDDHDGMMALMKKLSGGVGDMPSGGDYESEEGHEGHGEEGHSHEGEEDTCNECGMAYESCGCDHNEPVVDEEESRDQMAYNVAEDNPPDNGSANSTNATQGNDAANSALATADADEEEAVDESDEEDTTGEETDEEKVEEGIYESYANSADATFEADIDFMTKVISGGLNKQKSTGQTTVPVIAGQKNRMGVDGLGSPMKESTDLLKDYMKLSGL